MSSLIKSFFLLTVVVFSTSLTSFAQEQINPAPLSDLLIEVSSQIVDYDVSIDGAYAWVIVKTDAHTELRRWQLKDDKLTVFSPSPDLALQALAVHPANSDIYLLTRTKTGLSRIERLAANGAQWKTITLYETKQQLRRLIISAAKLAPSYLQKGIGGNAHRLYFAQNSSRGWTTHSIRDDGSAHYSLIGPDIEVISKDEAYSESPFQYRQGNTLPASIHPSGLAMMVQDDKGCFRKLQYATNDWTMSKETSQSVCGGFLSWSRNGVYYQHWRKGVAGVSLSSTLSDEVLNILPELQISAPPSSMPDGRHLLVQIVDANKQQHLQRYGVPIPAGDIRNAWMFTTDIKEVRAYEKNGGIFRPSEHESWKKSQMYLGYDAEAYQCKAGTEVPKRPYLVTTDLFWENVAAAYESLFILHERHLVMQSLDKFLNLGVNHYASQTKPSHFALALYVSAVVRDKRNLTKLPPNIKEAVLAEVEKVYQADGVSNSDLLKEDIDYAEFLPRGHYDANPQTASYFRAVRFLSSLKLKPEDLAEISNLPKSITDAALSWAKSYGVLIADARSPLAWGSNEEAGAKYAKELDQQARLFPLSWGFDNEIFHNTTYRDNWSKELQVSAAPKTPRVLPSGLDIAAVLGSDLAQNLLQTEFAKHPVLASRINALKQQAPTVLNSENSGTNLYHAWINTIANEFSSPPDNLPTESKELWQTKRLQTGLASWATLRHATILVNDMTGAQGGQGGFVFETVQHAPPRGAVEPDPQAFEKMAQLLDRIASAAKQLTTQWANSRTVKEMSAAYIARLQKLASVLRQLADMAKRQVAGKTLTIAEYAMIENIGGTAEHDFLLFKSLHNADGAVKEPDPIGKIADVARAQGSRLMAATGEPLEWDQAIGKVGARQLMRGAIYSYYEFYADHPITDDDWRSKESGTPRPEWVSKFMFNKPLACAALP